MGEGTRMVIMEGLVLSVIGVAGIFYFWARASDRKQKARIARIARIARLQRTNGPEANIWYMNLKGRRTTRRITIESIRPRGQDWLITAWCHEKKDFLVFCASRMYKYFDLNTCEDIPNVVDYFAKMAKDLAASKKEQLKKQLATNTIRNISERRHVPDMHEMKKAA